MTPLASQFHPPARSRGVTLIELLVVTAIIALLIAILIPSVNHAREYSRLVRCQTNIHAQLQAHFVYATNFNNIKPPLLYKSVSPKWDFSSPDTKWFQQPVGQGILVANNMLSFENLLCPSGSLASDRDIDRNAWNTGITSGSSYSYYWRDPTLILSTNDIYMPVSYLICDNQLHHAMIMDLNLEQGHAYAGEYAQRTWSCHPVPQKINIGFDDGSVRSVPNAGVILKYPAGNFEETQWWAQAEKCR